MRGDLEWGTIPGLIAAAAARHADAPAIVDGATTLSFTDLAGHARRAARAFLAAGVHAGDRVAIWAPNVWEWVPAALGVHLAGGVLVPLNTRYKGAEAADILARSRARVLLTIDGFLDTDYVALLDRAVDRPRDLPDLELVSVLRGDARADVEPWEAVLASGEGVSQAELGARTAEVRPGDLSDVLFTSGTTGRPKGVMQTHAATLRAFRDWSDIVGLGAGDRYLVVNPFFHSFGYKAGWLACLMTGATVYPQAVFDVEAVLGAIERHRITVMPGPPTLYQSLLEHPGRAERDLSSLQLAVTGAATIPVELVLRMRDELRIETVLTAYGLTEACGVVTACRRGDDPETIASTSGRALPGVEVRVVDGDGRERPPGEPGEVVVRGYNVMVGYLDDPSATAEVIDPSGWLHTGDVGVMDARGNLRITDRTKDMFVVGGFNAYPAEIEAALLRHEAIAQVAVVGVPDARLGEVGAAFVVLRPGSTTTPQEVMTWARAEMANFKVPRHVVLVDALPLNATGKVLKFRLREEAARLAEERAR